MQHEMWKLLCISLSMAVSKIEHSGNGKFNMHTDRWVEPSKLNRKNNTDCVWQLCISHCLLVGE